MEAGGGILRLREGPPGPLPWEELVTSGRQRLQWMLQMA